MKTTNIKVLLIVTAASIMLTGCLSPNDESVITESSVSPSAEVVETTLIDDQQVIENGLFIDMESGKSFCFVGDSITAGTATEGIGWYEPLTPFIRGEITNFSDPGWTSLKLTEVCNDIPSADVYVIAIGINDVLYIDEAFGATSPEEYVENLQILTDCLKTKSPDATFYFITPWPFLNFPEETYATNDEFVAALTAWCDGEERICIDPFDTIMSTLEVVDTSVYMWNDFHPNAPEGVGLYSYAVLHCAD